MQQHVQISEAEAKGFSRRQERSARQRERSKAARRGWEGRRKRGYVRSSPPRQRDRQAALAVAYPARCPSRKSLIAAYLADGGRIDGAETFAMVIRQDWKLCKVRGAHAGSTGPRRAQGLANAGRPRVSRTVRRHRARAVRLGLARYHHVHRGRDTPGRRDFLRVEVVNRCPPAVGSNSAGPSALCAVASARRAQTNRRICDARRANLPCHSPPGAAKVPAAEPPATTAAPGGGEPERVGKPQRGGLPECCNVVVTLLDAQGDVWEACCDRCGSEYGLPPAQQSVELLAAQAAASPARGP